MPDVNDARTLEPVTGVHGEARVLPPDKRGVGKKVPRGMEQFHGFWRVVYYPTRGEGLTAPEVLRANDADDARAVAERAVNEGFGAVADRRYA